MPLGFLSPSYDGRLFLECLLRIVLDHHFYSFPNPIATRVCCEEASIYRLLSSIEYYKYAVSCVTIVAAPLPRSVNEASMYSPVKRCGSPRQEDRQNARVSPG